MFMYVYIYIYRITYIFNIPDVPFPCSMFIFVPFLSMLIHVFLWVIQAFFSEESGEEPGSPRKTGGFLRVL